MNANQTAVVIALPDRAPAPPRNAPEILAELQAENERHAARMRELAAELAGAPQGAPPAERRQSKQQAAAALGITEGRLMQIIEAQHTDFPHLPPLAVQPGGKGSTWIILTDRVAERMSGRVC